MGREEGSWKVWIFLKMKSNKMVEKEVSGEEKGEGEVGIKGSSY